MRWVLPVIAVLLASLALGGCGHATHDPAHPAARATPVPVSGATGGGLRFAPCHGLARMRCATLRVPLDRSGRVPGTLRLRVAVSAGPAPRGDLVFLSGGPGQPAVPFATAIRARLHDALAGRRLVLLDQRGTGAGALRCAALQAAMGTSDLTVPPAGAVRACAGALGPRRAAFTTGDTVADLEALRRALGDPRWVIGGVSYGTFTAERYALAHPRRVRAMYLDSVVSHRGLDALGEGDFGPTERVLRLICARGASCPGDPVADLRALLRRGEGPVLIDTITALSIGTPHLAGLPEDLHEARAGRPQHLRELEAIVRRAQRAPAPILSQGLHAATLCADSVFPWPAAATPADRRRLAATEAARRAAGDPSVDAATAAGNGVVASCVPWPRVPPAPAVPAKLPAVPTLLLNGDEDLSTPLEWARAERRAAPRGTLIVVPRAGHSTLLRAVSDCPRTALADFLDGRRPRRC